jgi:FMN phosphatase YigB (HAD superfamily)
MAKRSHAQRRNIASFPKQSIQLPVDDPSKLEHLPISYQEVQNYFESFPGTNLYALRKETYLRIEKITGRPLICYTSKTSNVPPQVAVYIEQSDIVGFRDLIQPIKEDGVDVFIVSNGGSPEATERIVRMLRERFSSIRFFVPGNAYSAATMMCFSGEEIIVDMGGTLGPIDPQINGIPARAILRAFEELEERVKNEGPEILFTYIPLIEKYELHLLEICKSAQELSKELARSWLSTYMFKCDEKDERVNRIVEYFSDYDTHKSHSRSIDREKARELGLNIVFAEEYGELDGLMGSLHNQFMLMFDKSPFYKMYENSRGINWGRLVSPIKALPHPKDQEPQSA